jgi:calcineurin-like phosphoesterase family protein
MFIADTHFGHKNIIKYSARPFIDVTMMNEYIKNKWNEMISNDDIVYIVGDFARRDFKKYFNSLNGKKIFIQGNHDPSGIGIKQLELQINNYKFILSHYPINLNSHNAWLIHGHVHNNRLREYPFINFKKKTINVGVDVTKFYPVNLKWILNLIENKRDYLYLPSKII